MKVMHGLIFAYGGGARIRELTESRTLSSIPFGGRYRVIDFMLSSMVNSGITDVGVIMRENFQSLLDHLGSGIDWDLSRKRGGLWLRPPFGITGTRREMEYRGKMEALNQVYAYIERIKEKYVVLADGGLIANIALEDVLRHHERSGADITAVCSPSAVGLPQESTFFSFGHSGYVADVVEGAARPEGCQALGIYILRTELLLRLMNHCASRGLYSFETDVLQKMSGDLKISGYIWDGFASLLHSTAAYYGESMKLLRKDVRKALFNPERTIKTKVRDEPAAYYAPGARAGGSIVADGCYIEGAVENCVLFRGVVVERNAVVKNCILMQGTRVQSGAFLDYVIADKGVEVSRDRMLVGHTLYPITIPKNAVF